MANSYFDKFEFEKIWDIRNISINVCIEKFEEYIDRYPYDYAAKTYYIATLITAGKLNEAERKLIKIEQEISEDKSYQFHTDRVIRTKSSLAFDKVKLLLYQNKYQECYDTLIKYN